MSSRVRNLSTILIRAIAVVRVGEQVHILLNLDLVEDAQLQISSRLLDLSTVIRNGKEVR